MPVVAIRKNSGTAVNGTYLCWLGPEPSDKLWSFTFERAIVFQSEAALVQELEARGLMDIAEVADVRSVKP